MIRLPKIVQDEQTMPCGLVPADSTNAGLATWRNTFSDHFPLVIELKVLNTDNDVD